MVPPGRHHEGLALCDLRALARRRGGPDVLVVCGLSHFPAAPPARRPPMATRPGRPSPGQTESDRLDEALKESFPASDPVAVGHSEHAGPPKGHASGPHVEWFD